MWLRVFFAADRYRTVLARTRLHGVRAWSTALAALVSLIAALGLDAAERRVLRVGADPNNLPFSNVRGEGFENRIAELVARELRAELEYVWWPPRRGGVRESLAAGRADLVIGVPVGAVGLATTRAYYASTYVFVYRRGAIPVESFDDAVLRILRVGVTTIGDDFADTPPAHALVARGCIENLHGYPLYGDDGHESSGGEIVRAVARGEIDVAVAWGPFAGYYATRQSTPLQLAPVSPERDGPGLPFVFRIAMGVRKGDDALRRQLDEILVRCRDEIEGVLDDYGVPRVAPQRAMVEAHFAPKPH